jgi:uncharacterized protein YecT (DUF1311 family)
VGSFALRLHRGIVAFMKSKTIYPVGAALLVVATLCAGLPGHARAASRFDYKMAVTPEEGPVDPKIDGRYTASLRACQKRAKVTSQNADCFEAEFRRQDAKLNETWRTTLPRFAAASRQSLLAAQRKWVKERDPFCMKDADGFSGGTIVPVAYSYCRVELTIRRAIWLEELR